MTTEAMEQGAMQIIQVLDEHGFAAYLVGGCVRDKQLGHPVKDYDIATSAQPEQVQSLFERTIATGLQHGTVTVLLNHVPYEVTTFRAEAGYRDYRRPTEVTFIDSLEEDLRRRDFTMNAMAIGVDGQLVDPFGGMNDAREQLLRCVGHAEERFEEDALRMLRCVRFAAEYRLSIEAGTWQALLLKAPLLKHIAMERVRAELERMIGGQNPTVALKILAASGLLRCCKQKLALAQLDESHNWEGIESLTEPETRWAFIYRRIGTNAAKVLDDLRLLTASRTFADDVSRIVRAEERLLTLMAQLPSSEQDRLRISWIKTTLELGKTPMQRLQRLCELDSRLAMEPGKTPVDISQAVAKFGERWLGSLSVSTLGELAVSGKGLQQFLGIKPGPEVGYMLNELLEQVALGKLPNEQEALLEHAGHLQQKEK